MEKQGAKSYIPPQFDRLVLVGTGGTGGYLAQGLAKLIAGYRLDVEVLLIDPEVVEEKNIYRQNFHACEIGHPKAEVLASRLNMQFGTGFACLVGRGEDVAIPRRALIVTCVDSLSARQIYAKAPFWLDCGNGRGHGQVVFGTTDLKKDCKVAAKGWGETPVVKDLPNATLKLGLNGIKEQPSTPSCAEQPFAEQGCFVNEGAALCALTILHQLLVVGELTTPAIWFDTVRGRSTPARITRDYLLN